MSGAMRFARIAALVTAGALVGCSKRAADGREIPWIYGPTTGGAAAAHLQGTGKDGPALAGGWQLRLRGKQLAVRPFRLAESHPLFGKVAMAITLFDKDGKPLQDLLSGAITAQSATPTFDLDDAVVARLQDAVLWFRAV